MFNRDAYINEVKEEDRKFYRQVYDLEKRQAAASLQEVKPQKEIDIVQEAKAEDLINLFKNDLENQISRVEQLLTKTYTDGGASSVFNEILNDYTKTVGRYNAIVSRLMGRVIMDQKTREAIKIKFLDVKPQVDALFFSIDELIGKIANDMDLFVDNIVGRRITTPENVWPYLFGKLTNITGKKSDGFPIFVSWLSIYRSIVDIIRNQINSNSYRPIDNNEIRISINKFQSNLPKPDEEGFYFLDPIGKFSTLLSFYLNTRSGARFGDLKLEEKINKRVEELRGELGRDLTDDEIKEVRARLGAGGERLFIDPRLPTETRERVEYLQPAGTRGAKLTALYEPNYGGDDTGYQMGNFPDMEFPITDDFLNYDVAANIPPGQTLQRFKQLRRDRLRVKLLNYLSYFKPERFRKVEIEGIQEDRPTPNFDDINEKILEMNMRLGPLVQDNLDELGDLGNAVLQTTQLIDRLRDNPRITTQQIRDYYRLMERLTSLIFGIGSAYIESFYNLEEEPEAGIIEQEEAIEEGQEEEEEDEEEEFMPPDFMPAAEFEVEGFGKRRRKKIIKERMKKGRIGQILFNDSKNDPYKNYYTRK